MKSYAELKGRSNGKEGSSGVQASTDDRDAFALSFPSLYRFLAELRKKGHQMTSGTMTMFVEDGVYKLCLNDRPLDRSAFVAGNALAETFRIANDQLRTETVRWRQKGYQSQPNRRLFPE
jgi:hypothetical protein